MSLSLSLSRTPHDPTRPRERDEVSHYTHTHTHTHTHTPSTTPNLLRERDRNVVLFDFGKIRFISIKQFWKDTRRQRSGTKQYSRVLYVVRFWIRRLCDFRRFTDTAPPLDDVNDDVNDDFFVFEGPFAVFSSTKSSARLFEK